MSPKKIKIVDISPEQNNDIEPAIEQVDETPTIDPDNTEIQQQQQPAVIEAQPQPNEEVIKPITEEVEESKKTKVRTQELIECPKCHKMVTKKTLTYSHVKTCSGNEETPRPKRKPKPERIDTVREPIILQQTHQAEPLTFEEMRKQRMVTRMSEKKDSMKKLFLHAV